VLVDLLGGVPVIDVLDHQAAVSKRISLTPSSTIAAARLARDVQRQRRKPVPPAPSARSAIAKRGLPWSNIARVTARVAAMRARR